MRTALEAAAAAGAAGNRRARRAPPFPGSGRARAAHREGEGLHPRGRRVPDRRLAARRAADVGLRARALSRAAPRQPVAVPLPAGARRVVADRLVAGDGRQVRRPARGAEPDRRLDRAGRGRRRGPAGFGEGSRGARHARRPRPQRSLARLHARERFASSASSSRSASRTSRISCPRSRASCATA